MHNISYVQTWTIKHPWNPERLPNATFTQGGEAIQAAPFIDNTEQNLLLTNKPHVNIASDDSPNVQKSGKPTIAIP